jgi:manganese transport system substrate-binding protein
MSLKRLSSLVASVIFIALPVTAQEATAIPEEELPQLCPESVELSPDTQIVLTTFTVLADMASNIACGHLNVESLTRPGAEIHHYEPTPSDLIRAQEANLVLYNGLNLELWFEQFMEAVQDVPSVILTEGIEPVLIAEGSYKDLPNPHAWMSPMNALIYVENIRDAFIELDPENEAAYLANAEAYSAHIRNIDAFMRESLAELPEEQRVLVTCEGAFSYLTRDYGLQEFYMWAINADQQGSPRQIARLIDNVETNNVPALFCETTVSSEAMEVVAESTGARFAGSLFVDSLSEADGLAPTYLDLLAYDATTIVNGLLGRD